MSLSKKLEVPPDGKAWTLAIVEKPIAGDRTGVD